MTLLTRRGSRHEIEDLPDYRNMGCSCPWKYSQPDKLNTSVVFSRLVYWGSDIPGWMGKVQQTEVTVRKCLSDLCPCPNEPRCRRNLDSNCQVNSSIALTNLASLDQRMSWWPGAKEQDHSPGQISSRAEHVIVVGQGEEPSNKDSSRWHQCVTWGGLLKESTYL